MGGRIGITHVAAAAGVSITTVSHALNGRGKVSPATRARVRAVAEALGYEADRVASALRAGRSGVLALLSDEISTTPYAGRIVLGAQQAVTAAGLALVVVDSGDDPEVELRQLRALRAQRVDAVVYAAMYHRPVAVPPALAETPTVLLNGVDPGVALSSVVPDEFGTGRAATRLLLEAGHRRIAHLTVSSPGLAEAGRLAGCAAALQEAGLTPHVVRGGPTGVAETGRRAAAAALDEDPGTTAFFCFNDEVAMGAYQAASARGARVPEDISVVGVDDLRVVAEGLLPALTTFALPHAEMGRWAVEELLRMLEDPERPPTAEVLACPPVLRDSVSAPRAR